jgi:hypothetical protein
MPAPANRLAKQHVSPPATSDKRLFGANEDRAVRVMDFNVRKRSVPR